MVLKSVVAMAALLIGFLVPGGAGAAKFNLDAKLISKGKLLYERECAACHGISGRGDGEAAYLLFPQPRDFTSKVFKFRSTFQGDPPKRSDIMHTLRLGLPGSTMPSFVSIPESGLRALTEYVLSLAGLKCDPAVGCPRRSRRILQRLRRCSARGKRAAGSHFNSARVSLPRHLQGSPCPRRRQSAGGGNLPVGASRVF